MDLAWGPRNRTGLAAVDERGALVASASVHGDDEIVAWIERHAPRTGVVAIDAPLVVANVTGSRACEQLIQAAFGRFDAGGYPSNTSNPHFDPPRALTLAKRLGLGIDPEASLREHVAIEVYPHPAMVGLFELGRTLKYKRKKQGFETQHAETVRLLDLMEGLEVLRLRSSVDWARMRDAVERSATAGSLGKVEDEIDAIFCAHLAWLWSQGAANLEVYGDVQNGYIVAPPPPTWSPSPRSVRAEVEPRADDPVVFESDSPSTGRGDGTDLWARLEALVTRLPMGTWTTYGDIAVALGTHARPVSERIRTTHPSNYWRILTADGSVSTGFRWKDGRTDAERSVLAHLRDVEGVPVVDDRAPAQARLAAAALRGLLPGAS
ncbi:DUF429 domain-containing protein [Agrococcus sp. GCM10030264]